MDLLAPAQALATLLAPHGKPVGTIGAVTCFTPDPPYSGPMPLVMIRPLPTRGQIAQEGARGYVVNGVLDLWYLAQVAQEQGRPLAAIEADAATNLDLIITTILQNPNLSGSVVSIKPPLQYLSNPDGPYAQIADAMYFYLGIRVPFTGAGGLLCFS